MDSVKIKTYVGQDGVLSLRLPISNQDVEAMVIYQPITKNSHQESKRKFKALLERHAGKTFSDSTALLQEDRQRD
jgi:hypothetical protein